MPNIPEPVKVSPIIKFFRYAFLCAGILYGATKLKALKVLEEGRKEERERKKVERELKLAEEKRIASERDIAAIVAIFKGNEKDSVVTDQSNVPQTNKLEKEEVKEIKQIVHDDSVDTVSDDHSTCTMEEVRQMVQSDKTVPSPTVNTEFGSLEESKTDSVCPKEGTTNKEKGDIFSDVFNLTTTEDKKSDSLNPQVKRNVKKHSDDSRSKSNAPQKNEDRQSQENGYFVETFSEKVPFAEPETREEDFYRKDDK